MLIEKLENLGVPKKMNLPIYLSIVIPLRDNHSLIFLCLASFMHVFLNKLVSC